MLVLVVGGVAVVDAARVVAHAGDGHAVGVAEHRRHHSTVFSVQSMCRVGTICTLTPPRSLHRPASLSQLGTLLRPPPPPSSSSQTLYNVTM